MRKSSIVISSEAQSKSKNYPTPATVSRKVDKEFQALEGDGLMGSKEMQHAPIHDGLSDMKKTTVKVKGKSPMKFKKPKDEITSTKIVAASESGSNEDLIEKISPPWVKNKTPTKYGKEVGGIRKRLNDYRISCNKNNASKISIFQ